MMKTRQLLLTTLFLAACGLVMGQHIGTGSNAYTGGGDIYYGTSSTSQIGFGLTSPVTFFHVLDSFTNNSPHFIFDAYNNGGGSNGGDVFQIHHGRGSGFTGNLLKVYNATYSSAFIVEGDGDVGINVANPVAKLDCDGDAIFNNSGANEDFRVESNQASQAIYVNSEASGVEEVIINGDLTSNLDFRFSDNVIFGDASENRCGIKTNTPATALTVQGVVTPSTDATFDLGSSTLSLCWDTIFYYDLSQCSDKRMKQQIKPLKYGLAEVMKLNPVSYMWKAKPEKGTSLGLLAQEVEPIIKEVVSKPRNPEGRYTMNYVALIPVLINAIQEQETDNEELEKEVESLKADVEELKEMIASNQTLNSSSVNLENPQGIILNQNDPNPFRERTVINYTVPEDVGSASIIISDVRGQLVKEVSLQPGTGQLEIFASDLSSGTYTYSIVADGQIIDSKKMIVNK